MLLLMVNAELDPLRRFARHTRCIEASDGVFNVPAIREDGIERRTREGGAQLFLRLIGDVVVIAVEEPEEVGMKGLIAGEIFA
jgi:hypothetical protein